MRIYFLNHIISFDFYFDLISHSIWFLFYFQDLWLYCYWFSQSFVREFNYSDNNKLIIKFIFHFKLFLDGRRLWIIKIRISFLVLLKLNIYLEFHPNFRRLESLSFSNLIFSIYQINQTWNLIDFTNYFETIAACTFNIITRSKIHF